MSPPTASNRTSSYAEWSASGLSFTHCLRSRSGSPTVRALELRGQLVQALVDSVNVVPARQPQLLQGALDGLVDHALDVASPALDLVHQLSWHERTPYVIEQRLAPVVQGVRPRVDKALGAAFFFGEHDLREDHLRQVGAAVAVDDPDVVAVAHQLRDAVEGHVAARPRVVQLAVRVLLDKVSFGARRQFSAILTRCVMGFRHQEVTMATRKRPAARSRLNRAVRAGRSALRSAEKRVPPDVRKQIDRSIKDGQKRFDAAVKDVRTRVNKAARQADLDKVMKRLDGLSKQVSQLARRVTTRPAASTATRRPAARRAATRKPAARKPAARRPAARKPAARKPAARKPAAPKTTTAARKPAARPSTPRRTAPSMEPVIRYVPPSVPEAPGPMPVRVDTEST